MKTIAELLENAQASHLAGEDNDLRELTLVQEAQILRESISKSAERLHEISKTLYSETRRKPASDYTSSYLLVAQSGQRVAGMVSQGLRRLMASDRTLLTTFDRKEQEIEYEKIREARAEERKKKAEQAAREARDPWDDEELIELYGKGIL